MGVRFISLHLVLYAYIGVPTYTERNMHWKVCYREDAPLPFALYGAGITAT